MWARFITTSDYGLKSFSDFLVSDEYYAAVLQRDESHRPACLLDFIEIWVGEGDATEVCPTFETFLLTVIAIIDEWYQDHTLILCYPLYPEHSPEDGEIRDNIPGRPVPLIYDAAQSNYDPPVSGDQLPVPADHPVLRRENYEMHQAMRRARCNNELRALLEHHQSD